MTRKNLHPSCTVSNGHTTTTFTTPRKNGYMRSPMAKNLNDLLIRSPVTQGPEPVSEWAQNSDHGNWLIPEGLVPKAGLKRVSPVPPRDNALFQESRYKTVRISFFRGLELTLSDKTGVVPSVRRDGWMWIRWSMPLRSWPPRTEASPVQTSQIQNWEMFRFPRGGVLLFWAQVQLRPWETGLPTTLGSNEGESGHLS